MLSGYRRHNAYIGAFSTPILRFPLLDLVADILDGEPFTDIGKPEPLKYIAANTRSRRIDLGQRLVYQVDDNCIVFLQARYHYEY